MHIFLLLLAVVGSAVARPQFASRSFPGTSPLIPPTSNFPTQTFGSAVPAPGIFTQDTRSFAPTTAGFAPQVSGGFQPVAANRRVVNLDSTVFAPEGGVAGVSPDHFNRDSFNRQQHPYRLISRTEYLNDNNEFSSSYQQDNGQKFTETGRLHPTNDGKDNVIVKEGNYEFITPEGVPVSVTYTADEYGFHPISASIPQPPAPITPVFT